MKNIPQDFIEQVKHANNIVTVAGRYLPLKQKGRQFWACCPFHHEKTPSFTIHEQDQYYHCFGCGVSGNVFSLVGHLENIDFVYAVELLAKWANLKLPESAYDPQEIQKQRYKQKLLDLVDHARQFYIANLGEVARKYLNNRGISDELIKTFNIGQSPDWDGVIRHLKQKGYTEAEITDAGVTAKSEKGRIYDAMAERITFAIFDLLGNCIGFTGRVLPEKDNGNVAKYRNTAQTIIFDKGKIVYGSDVLKKYLRTAPIENLIFVEGNVDVISLVASGFPNVVASMGTAVSAFHAKTAKRFSTEIYICFDGDTAGVKATMRAVDIFAEEKGLNIRVIELPKDTDPDSFVKQNGKDEFQKLIDTAKPMIDYKLDMLERQSNLSDSLGKTKYLDQAKQILKNIPYPELYFDKISKVSGIKIEGKQKTQPQKKTPTPKIPPKIDRTKEAKEFMENYEQKKGTLRGTNQELEKQYQDCKKIIEYDELLKRRKVLQKEIESGNMSVLGEIQEINRRLKSGTIK